MTAGYPKASRLLKSSDFRFARFVRKQTRHFTWILNPEGRGRLGISISKKTLKSSVARNRVKRLLREVFRSNHSAWVTRDIHVIGRVALRDVWREITPGLVESEMMQAGKN